ncbi:ankyrin [Daldinia bambusicola]|nr:ankyrin [Daldinia bambusicola]
MDVVSAVASFIAIGQAIAAMPKVIDALQSLFGARREIVQLLNDLEVLKAFGDILRDTIQCLPEANAEARLSVPKTTYPLVKRIEKDMSLVVSQLEDLCRACQQEGKKPDQIKAARIKWLWYQRKIATLNRKVKENRECLQLILSCTSLCASTSHGKILLDIHTIVTTQTQQTPFALPPSQSAIEESHESESITCITTDHDTSAPMENSVHTLITQETSSQLTPSNVSREDLLRVNYSEEPVHNLEPSVQITAALRRPCPKDCACQCHSSTSRIRSQPADSVIYGWLKSAYNSAPRLGAQRCDVATCQRRRSPSRFSFRIPLLFCSRTLEATLSLGSITGAGASLHLHVPRNISMNINLYFHLRQKNVKGVCWELSYNRYSPIDLIYNTSVLYLCIDTNMYEAIPILLTGAKSILRGSQYAKEAAALARLILQSGNIEGGDKAILRDVIALDDERGTDGFWPVHEAVRTGGDLIAALKESPDDIDVLDDIGRAPLHLAVAYGSNEAMRILISHGANLSCSDIWGRPPLLQAARHGHYDQVQLLIDAGCDIESRNHHGNTSLFIAAASPREGSGKVCSLLLRHGACSFNRARNVLHMLASSPNAADIEEKFQLFVHAGVDKDEKDIVGVTCLQRAFHYRNGYMLRLLLNAGCRFDERPGSSNILEQAAFYGDTETIDNLEQTGLKVDVRVQREVKCTPLGIFEWRMKADPLKNACYPLSRDDIDSFYNLLGGVRDRYLTAEIQTLKKVITYIEGEEITLAREILKSVIQEKIGWNIPAECRTFRAIDVQIREGMMEAAIESLEEFIEVSKERIGSDPRGNDYFYDPTDGDEGILIGDED